MSNGYLILEIFKPNIIGLKMFAAKSLTEHNAILWMLLSVADRILDQVHQVINSSGLNHRAISFSADSSPSDAWHTFSIRSFAKSPLIEPKT